MLFTIKLLFPTLLIFGLAAAMPQKVTMSPGSTQCIGACTYAEDNCREDGAVEDFFCIAADAYCEQNCDTTTIGKRSPQKVTMSPGSTQCIGACTYAEDNCREDGAVEDFFCIAADAYCEQNCDTTTIGKRS